MSTRWEIKLWDWEKGNWAEGRIEIKKKDRTNGAHESQYCSVWRAAETELKELPCIVLRDPTNFLSEQTDFCVHFSLKQAKNAQKQNSKSNQMKQILTGRHFQNDLSGNLPACVLLSCCSARPQTPSRSGACSAPLPAVRSVGRSCHSLDFCCGCLPL